MLKQIGHYLPYYVENLTINQQKSIDFIDFIEFKGAYLLPNPFEILKFFLLLHLKNV